MNILVTIPHYYNFDRSSIHGSSRTSLESRTASLTKTIMSLHQHLGKLQYHVNFLDEIIDDANIESRHNIDIYIITTGTNNIISKLPVESNLFTHLQSNSTPMMLGFECRNILLDNRGKYDYYCYMEDDIILSDPFFFGKLAWFNSITDNYRLLQPNRYEVSIQKLINKLYIDGDVYIMPEHLFYKLDGEDITSNYFGQQILFHQPLNPHSGCYFLNSEQFDYWSSQKHYNDGDTSLVGPLESAATLGLMKTFSIYKPAPYSANFLELEHFGNAHINITLGNATM